MRKVFITHSNLSKGHSFFIVLDGNVVGTFADQDFFELEVDDNAHEINTSCAKGIGNTYNIKMGDADIILDADLDVGTMTYTLKYSFDKSPLDSSPVNREKQYITKISDRQSSGKSYGLNASIISAIIIGMVVCGICFIMYNFEIITNYGLIGCIICIVGFVISMIIGGFWIIIIPLPFIFVFKAGCVDQGQSITRIIVSAILTCSFLIIGIVLLFVLG